MNLQTLWRALRRGWWIVLTALALSLAGGAIVTSMTTPIYQSTVAFFVRTPSEQLAGAYQGDQFAQKRVNSYAQLASSERLATEVINDTQLPLTSADVMGMVTAKGDLNTVLLNVTVSNSDPQVSLDVARSVSKELVALVADVEGAGTAGSAAISLEVISSPTLDPVPVTPRPLINLLLAAALGLVIGISVAVLREILDVTVKSAASLRDTVEAPVLASIPWDSSAKTSPLILHGEARSIRAEAFRQLRTNLQFVDVDNPVRVLAISSAVANEGKSSTAANLAVAFSEAGQRVLLVEADLRRPKVAEYLGLETSIGLTNVLAGQVAIDEVLQSWGQGGLTVLASGSHVPNPSELLGSQSMVDLLASLRRTFDLIILDTPPLLPVTDGAVLAARADGVLLVVRNGGTTRSQAASAATAVRAVDARLLGSVLNMVPLREAQASGYGSYYGDHEPAPMSAPTQTMSSATDELTRT